ncbi:MAG: hypothetical protein WA746_17020 [Isosphaeraceae bacterium]
MTTPASTGDPNPPTSSSGDVPIEGGEVREIGELPYHDARHKAETARSLAKWLLVILGASLGTHYLLTAILAFGGKEEAMKNLNSILNAWLPAVSSLVSAAVTYYFTKEKA